MSRPLVIASAGKRRSGKTTRTKELLKMLNKHRDMYIHDVNNEYSEEGYQNTQLLGDYSIQEFLSSIKNVENAVICFEEASIAFDNRSSSEILKMKLVRCRHQNNVILLNFHSFRMFPNYITDLCDFIRLHKTNDTEKTIKDKKLNNLFMQCWEEVNKSSDNFECAVYDCNEGKYFLMDKIKGAK